MYRTLCVLVLLTLQTGLVHSFSWDIAMGFYNRLEYYNEEKLTYTVAFIYIEVTWITYDPFHNRVLFMNSSNSLLSFDMATKKIQTLIELKPVPTLNYFAYDPATGLLFGISDYKKMYSYLVKPGSNHDVDPNFVIDLGEGCLDTAVDSCGGYIYWIASTKTIERARLNGFEREEVIEASDRSRFGLTIDPQTQNMYWTEDDYSGQYFILSADLNGKHRRTLNHGHGYYPTRLTVSKDFIYWTQAYKHIDNRFWKFPKNLPLGTDVEPKKITMNDTFSSWYRISIAANYAIEEQSQGTPLCKALKRLLPNHSATNDSDSLNVSTGGSLLRVNETKVSEESRVGGDTCDVSVCHNYCLQGNCSTSADGQPKCSCYAGYTGERCQVDVCQGYCLHGGVCSLSAESKPHCRCTEHYEGERCDVPVFQIKCAISLLKDILDSDVTTDKAVKSSCASTAV